MPWRWSSILAVALLLSACVQRTDTWFIPSEDKPRLDTNELRDQADYFLRVECPRLLAANKPGGEAAIKLTINRSGEVTRSEVTRSSGDEEIDGIFGPLAAQLVVTPPPDMTKESMTVRLGMGYACSGTTAATTVRFS
jgi:TonB family protein